LLETILAMLAPTYVEQNTKMEITVVRQYVKSHYSETQWKCIDELWQRESSWQTKKKPWRAKNPSSGAYGIPQSLPAKKMASHGLDYLTNPIVQVNWGMSYINSRYKGSPCRALAFHDRKGWY
jgi:hypothetical protein